METSDSECFESADEDFQSDDENTQTVISEVPENKKNVIKTEVDNKVNIDKNKNRPENLEETKSTEKLVVEVSEDNLKNKNYVEETNTEKICDNPIKNLTSDIDVNKKERVAKKPKEVRGKLGSKVLNAKDRPNISKDDTKRTLELSNETKTTTECTLSKVETKKEDLEENLWDDDEIDWGKEELLDKEQSDKHTTEKKSTSDDIKKSNEEPNLWEEDDWEPIEHVSKEVIETKQEAKSIQSDSGWGGWGNWGGVTSILNSATQSVSTLTNHVSQGISTVLETGIGVPDPEDLAREHKADEEEIIKNFKDMDLESKDTHSKNSLGGFGLGNFVSGVSHLTKLVETTGTKVITGGLDTLETIGKKTMEVLQEGDPGLKKKRAFLKLDQNKPILSQVLREAKEKSDAENKALEQRHIQRKAKNYETLFDDHQGLVHLEALEMLSRQCDIKLETLSENCTGDALTEMQETLDQVKELCELPEEDEDETLTISEIKEKIETAVGEINIGLTYSRLFATWTETEAWLENLKLNLVDENELHQQGIETLAQLTAIAVEQFHKAGELLLVKEHRSTADEADSLVQLTSSLISLIGIVAAKFSEKLNSKAPSVKNKESVNELITNVFFEASNSSSYIQDAFQLLIPVLQVGAV